VLGKILIRAGEFGSVVGDADRRQCRIVLLRLGDLAVSNTSAVLRLSMFDRDKDVEISACNIGSRCWNVNSTERLAAAARATDEYPQLAATLTANSAR
jgi:hypothetical protein